MRVRAGRVALVMGFNVHAGAAIDGRGRKRVERVCRYLVRPPIAKERLGLVGEGESDDRKAVRVFADALAKRRAGRNENEEEKGEEIAEPTG